MYNSPYFIPGFYTPPVYGMMRGILPGMSATRGLSFMSRLGNGLSWFRNINWGNLINGASRTLGVVNQTIPLVRQVGPMVNNMRSMFKVFSAFRDVTDNSNISNVKNNNPSNKNISQDKVSNSYVYDSGPTFFTN